MPDFQYLQPVTVAEASALLAQHGEDALLVAGGTGVLQALHNRSTLPTTLISLAAVDGIQDASYRDDKGLKMGALMTLGQIATHPDIRANYPMLAQAVENLATQPVRDQGTLGGTLCAPDGESEPATVLLALGARAMVGGARGDRYLTIDQFLLDRDQTALAPDEVLMRVYIPAHTLNVGQRARFFKEDADARPFFTLAIAATHEGGVYTDVRIVTGAVTPVPRRIASAEALLEGKAITSDLIAQAAALIADDVNLTTDGTADADHRRTVVTSVSHRTLADVFNVQIED